MNNGKGKSLIPIKKKKNIFFFNLNKHYSFFKTWTYFFIVFKKAFFIYLTVREEKLNYLIKIVEFYFFFVINCRFGFLNILHIHSKNNFLLVINIYHKSILILLLKMYIDNDFFMASMTL